MTSLPGREELLARVEEGESREVAWVIESGGGTYWAGRAPDDFEADHNDAVRFARQCDAERVRCWLIDSHNHALSKAVRASEHVWIVRTASQTISPATEQDTQDGRR